MADDARKDDGAPCAFVRANEIPRKGVEWPKGVAIMACVANADRPATGTL